MRNRGIGRGRMFMGAILLLAALVTWGIVLMMSPHGDTVVHGTRHLRPTIVTFKRNGAIGTLILSALAGWMLFPTRRPKWPARDWTLIALLVFLAGSSAYTLISLPANRQQAANVYANVASVDTNSDWNADGAGSDMNSANFASAPPQFDVNEVAPRQIVAAAPKSKDRERVKEQRYSAEAKVTDEEADRNTSVGPDSAADEPANNETVENQE